MYAKQDEAAPMGGQQQHPPRPAAWDGRRERHGFKEATEEEGGITEKQVTAASEQTANDDGAAAEQWDRYPGWRSRRRGRGAVPTGDGKRPSAGDDGTSLGVEVSADTDWQEDESTETWFDNRWWRRGDTGESTESFSAGAASEEVRATANSRRWWRRECSGRTAPGGVKTASNKRYSWFGRRLDVAVEKKTRLVDLEAQQARRRRKRRRGRRKSRKEEEEEKPPSRPPSAPPVAIEKKAAPTRRPTWTTKS